MPIHNELKKVPEMQVRQVTENDVRTERRIRNLAAFTTFLGVGAGAYIANVNHHPVIGGVSVGLGLASALLGGYSESSRAEMAETLSQQAQQLIELQQPSEF